MLLPDGFADDTRAVAPLIGFILLFGLFVVAFSGHQASAVPQQNAETELQHYQNVQNDLTVVRNAISRAGQQNQRQFESVRLGTTYRERVLALNPPSPAGDLRTSDEYDIRIQRGDGAQVIDPVSTRFLEYRNQYHELDIDAIRYEHSVLYLTDAGGCRIGRLRGAKPRPARWNGHSYRTTGAVQRLLDRSGDGRVVSDPLRS